MRIEPDSGNDTQKEDLFQNRGLLLLNTIFASANTEVAGLNDIERHHPQNATSTYPDSTPTHPQEPKVNVEPLAPSSQLHHHQSPRSRPVTSKSSTRTRLSATYPESELSPLEPRISPRQMTVSSPQVLTQDVISRLLGQVPSKKLSQTFTHTRSSSASTASSRLSPYSGDAEDEDDGGPADSDAYSGYSRPSTVFDIDADVYDALAAVEVVDLQSQQAPEVSTRSRVNGGDVTPRAPCQASSFSEGANVRRSGGTVTSSSPPFGQDLVYSPERASRPPSYIISNTTRAASNLFTSADPVQPSVAPTTSALLDPRTPAFSPEAHSELWPDSRGPIDDRMLDDDGDIVELDFADTSALNDADAFMSKVRERGKRDVHLDKRENVQGRNERKEKEKKSLKEKRGVKTNLENQQNSASKAGPMPSSSQTGLNTKTAVLDTIQKPSSSSPVRQLPSSVNGEIHVRPDTPPPNQPNLNHVNDTYGTVSRRVTAYGQGAGIDRDALRQSLLAVTSPGRLPHSTEMNEFVRELLTLIHVSLIQHTNTQYTYCAC
jgi:hypothetical protein